MFDFTWLIGRPRYHPFQLAVIAPFAVHCPIEDVLVEGDDWLKLIGEKQSCDAGKSCDRDSMTRDGTSAGGHYLNNENAAAPP